MKSVKVVLRNYQTGETIDYNIIPADNQLAQDWITALEQDVLQKSLHLEKNYCFHGFPYTQRTLDYLCSELNRHIFTINQSTLDYTIEESFIFDQAGEYTIEITPIIEKSPVYFINELGLGIIKIENKTIK